MIDMVAISETFRENVRHRLEASGLTKADLARRMSASPQYVNNYLTESNPVEPGLSVLARFAEGLGCKPHELLEPQKVPA